MRYDGLIIPRTYNDYFPRSKPQEIIEVLERYGFVDAELDKNSINPVQNKVIAELIPENTTKLVSSGELSILSESVQSNSNNIGNINTKIPTQATEQNQLADKEFVNSSISTNTAHYIYKTTAQGEKIPFSSIDELEAYTGIVTPNDYAIVTGVDESGNVFYDRYKADVLNGVVSWGKEYRLNNSTFTSEQWAAIQSGITQQLVNKLINIQLSLPIGIVIPYAGTTAPQSFLLCNGQEIQIEEYPELYSIIKDIPECQSENEGYFKVPDLREITIVGAGKNTTLNITEHDEYDVGEFKDDQMQGHKHTDSGHSHWWSEPTGLVQTQINAGFYAIGYQAGNGYNPYTGSASANLGLPTKYNDEYGEPRNGKTTHGKQVGFNYIIKAKA